ncbi:MAG: hypothetical protein V8S34_04090 [Lawsonibacter sp.]
MTVVGSMPGVAPGGVPHRPGRAGCATLPMGPSSRPRWWSAACPRG